ncbi:MAG: teichoic acid glycerol-phosphate transferase [Ilumatobacteraceae bacterium]|nr:teichoic acid glycerol-phosphate transferase [Ilumatobacteraceae bacterium]
MRERIRLPAAVRSNLPVGRRVVRRVGVALLSLMGIPFRWLSGLVPRDPRLVVVGGNAGRFTDNARYLFLGLAHDEELRCVWITGDRAIRDHIRSLGLESELRWSPAGIRRCLRAGWYVFGAYLSDINYWTSRGALSFNLWHGIPMKAIEFDITSGPLARLYASPSWSPLRLAFLDRFHTPDFLLSTSSFITTRCFAPAFRMPPERCLEFGYPRTDHFRDPSSADARQLLALPRGVNEVVGYFPTWRDDGYDFLGGSGFSFDRLNEALVEGNRFLLFKAHPNFSNIAPKESSWSNIRILDATADLYQVLPACDVLVTDYSSIAYDYLLLDRPIVYFVPDHDRYVRHRNVYFSFEEMAVGPVILECEDLYNTLRSPMIAVIDRPRHDKVSELVWNGYKGDAVQRIRNFLFEQHTSADQRSSATSGRR